MSNAERARLVYNLIATRFKVPGSSLFYEHVAAQSDDRKYSYLWPYSSVISAANALAEMKNSGADEQNEVRARLDALKAYYDPNADPKAYESYVLSDGGGDKFYDDNEWLGLEFIEAYRALKDAAYLQKAKEIFTYAISGWSEALGGGIFWKQGDDSTRNTCSNGPAAVLAAELYQETKDNQYLDWAKKILKWLAPLKSPDVGVYYDHVNKSGAIDKSFYTYNTGTPMHANALLFAITGDEAYLNEARALAASSFNYFAGKDILTGLRFFPDTPWFNAVLLRGYIALFRVDPKKDSTYIDAVQANVDYAWADARGKDGAFSSSWTGRSGVSNPSKALIDQGALAEVYARLSAVRA